MAYYDLTANSCQKKLICFYDPYYYRKRYGTQVRNFERDDTHVMASNLALVFAVEPLHLLSSLLVNRTSETKFLVSNHYLTESKVYVN